MEFYDFKMEDIEGYMVDFSQYKGKVVLVVNTASKCGYTPQLQTLQEVYEKFKDKGLVILGFPCNQYLRQDPGTNTEILTFCRRNYGVTFPMFSKIKVKGRNQAELYKYLVNNSPVRKGKSVKWNFEKFLINKNGEIVNRYSSNVDPLYIREDIRELL